MEDGNSKGGIGNWYWGWMREKFSVDVSFLIQVEKDVAIADILTIRFRLANDSLCFSLPRPSSLELDQSHPISAQQEVEKQKSTLSLHQWMVDGVRCTL